ncbi:MAG: prephenate dehydratase [Alphaproteobacteria bacterium]|nr:prephenate dehydratase [Alphaproteobacteria bacterium]MCB9975299.1 prephenate dehydratase [Rhodospirillales bacterium]
MKKPRSIAFQGAHGAYSDMACRAVYPGLETVPCNSFDEAFAAVNEGRADLAMIPVDNTIAGRVADVHHLMPEGELFIIGEHFQLINHMLLGVKGAKIEDLKYVHSHVHALPQCRKYLSSLDVKPRIHADTAGAAQEIAERQDKAHGAIASTLAAEIYGLDILATEIEDRSYNTTRFLILAPEPIVPDTDAGKPVITSLFFQVRNIPAALYKALGGFATNGLSLTKLESYVDETFSAATFYCDIEGHAESRAFKLALEELGFYAKDVRFLGTYPAHEFRSRNRKDPTEL